MPKTRIHIKTEDVPEVSLVLSCYDRPELLPASLGSIFAQSMKDFNVLVTDNAPDDRVAARHKEIVDWFCALDKADGRKPRFLYHRTAGKLRVDDCYWSAEYGVERLRKLGLLGRWIGTPCDDTIFFQYYLQIMLAEAATNLWECVTCGTPVIAPNGPTRSTAGYSIWDIGTQWAGKTTYLVRSKHWIGFPGKPLAPGPAAADTSMILALQRRGVSMGQVRQPAMAHQ